MLNTHARPDQLLSGEQKGLPQQRESQQRVLFKQHQIIQPSQPHFAASDLSADLDTFSVISKTEDCNIEASKAIARARSARPTLVASCTLPKQA